jgi:hypothetical protein
MPSLDADADKDQLMDFARSVRAHDARVFNKYSLNATAPTGQRAALMFERDIILRSVGQAHHTPLILFPNNMELALLYRIPEAGKAEIDGQDRPRDDDFDKMVRPVMRFFWDKMKNVDVWRIGKIYEHLWGPFDEDEALKWVLERFVRQPAGMPVVGANAFLLFQDSGMNINLTVQTGTSPQGSVISTRLDINNIDGTQRLQMNNLDAILSFATRFFADRFGPLVMGDSK